MEARVIRLDSKGGRVTVLNQQQQELEYDYLVYALGSMMNRKMVPGGEHYAYAKTNR